MTEAEEDEVRKLIYEELTDFFRHVSGEAAKAGGTSGGRAGQTDALLKLMARAARERYIKSVRPS